MVLLVAGCIGVLLALYLLAPGAFAAVFPYSLINGSEPSETPENTIFQGADGENITAPFPEPVSDDERLEALIVSASVSLLEISVGQIYSAHTHDDVALRNRAADICTLAGSLRADALALEVSPEKASVRSDFVVALDEFIVAGTLPGGGAPLSQSLMDEALDHLTLGAEHLSGAIQGCKTPHTESSGTGSNLMNLMAESIPVFPDALQIGSRFCFDDAGGANSGSLIVSQAKTLQSFYTVGEKPQNYVARPGESFLLVIIRATHLGHKGDGTNYRLQIPRESAFTLHYTGETYSPISSPGPTNRGESYSGGTLDRRESISGYLFFEVPEDIDLSHAYIEASIGRSRPVWSLAGEG